MLLELADALLSKIPGTELTREQIQNAIAAHNKYMEVHGTPVTKAQLESLRG